VLMEKTAGGSGGQMFGKKKTESYFPDVGILIGGDFDPGVGLRQQKSRRAERAWFDFVVLTGFFSWLPFGRDSLFAFLVTRCARSSLDQTAAHGTAATWSL